MIRAAALSLILGAAARAQTPVPLPPACGLDAPSLDRIFDGKGILPAFTPVFAGQRPDFIIRPETSESRKAPRFALNLDAVPPEMRSTVEGFDELFHKNQEETEEWVEHVNRLVRERNASGLYPVVPEWTYDGRPNEPPWSCLSDAAGTVNDWWAQRLGRGLPTYESANNGRTEEGLDPRLLELEYFRRVAPGDSDYYFLLPKLLEADPIRDSASPFEPKGYAELLIEDRPYEAADPYTGKTYRWEPGMSAMEGRYVELFTNSIFHRRTPDKYARILAEALEKWGIAYVQLEDTKRPQLGGAHAVAVVGYFCMEGADRLIRCSDNRTDEDWARTTWFIAHDSFGDYPAARPQDPQGGPAYRAVRIMSIDQAIVFPHGLRVSAQPAPGSPGAWSLEVTNLGGRPVKLLGVEAEASGRSVPVTCGTDGGVFLEAEPGLLKLRIEARHYYEADGGAREFSLRLDPDARTLATEAARTPPSPSYRQRLRDSR